MIQTQRGWRRAYNEWSLLRNTLVLADGSLIIIVALLCHRFYLGDWLPTSHSIGFVELSWLTTMLGFAFSGAYNRAAMQSPVVALNTVIVGGGGALTATLLLFFMLRGFVDLSRGWVGLTWIVTAIVLIAAHLAASVLALRLMKGGYLRERIAFVGTGPRAIRALESFRAASTSNVTVVGVFDDRRTRIPEEISADDLKGNTDSLIAYIRAEGVDRVIITLPWTAEERIIQLVTKLRQAPVRVDLIPHNVIWGFALNIDKINGVPVFTVANHRIDIQTGWLKRFEDLCIGTVMLVCLSPIMLLIALAVRLNSPGPVLFRQQRFGFNNRVFEVYKFRSMSANRPPDDGSKQATKSDPRVTKVGRFLRRSSLDELPQLFNVLEGTMSLVGPRPHALPQNHEFGDMIDEYFARHNVKPGITGWAQVNGYRGETDIPEKMSGRVRFDIHYIQHWSILFDLKILILTVLRIWTQKTAY